MTGGTRRAITAVVALVAWAVAVQQVAGLAGDLGRMGTGESSGADSLWLASDSLIEQALASRPALEPFEYNGTFDTPFLPLGRRSARPGRPGVGRTTPRPELRLTGVLLDKNRPQAILQDVKGRTHILGVGDSVAGQQVVRIRQDDVLMRGGGGTYTISVRE